MSRLSIEISPEQHKKIKALAALQGKSIKDLILDRLFSSRDGAEQAAWDELENLLLSRIDDAKAGISKKTLQQITDEIVKAENP